jgi:hypothetical protein
VITTKILNYGVVDRYDNWRKQCNKELKQLLGDLDILSFVTISQWNWIGHVNRMDSKRKVSQVFNNNNPHGSRLRGLPKYRWWNYVRTDINNAKLKSGKRGQNES